jgi:pimeloyl-ACP methyl ester carboxylesterase
MPTAVPLTPPRWVFIPGALSTAPFISTLLPAAIAQQMTIETLPECNPVAPRRVWGQWGRGGKWLNQRLQQHSQTGPIVIFAHSLGVQYALRYAQHYPNNLAALVLLAPTYGRGWVLRTLWQLLKILRHPPRQWWARLMLAPVAYATPRAQVIAPHTPIPSIAAACWQMVTVLSLLGRGVGHLPTCPVLMIRANDDGLVPPHRTIPNIPCWDVTGGHFMWLQDAALWQRIEAWLAATGVAPPLPPSPR